MKREKNYKTAKFVEALEYIDVRYIEEAGKKIKERPAGQTVAGMSRAKSLRQVLALVACVLLLSAVIPAVTYLMGHLPDILGSSTGDDTTEQTSPETPPEETSSPAPETSVDTDHETTAPLYDGTTAPPEIEYDGSRGLLYKMSDDGKSAYLAGMGICTDENIVVASTYDGYPVTMIGESALSGYDRVKSVTIPDSVSVIDHYAFMNCTALESVTIPDKVNYIGAEAFSGTAIKNIKLPSNLTMLLVGAFKNCPIEEVVIPYSVEVIDSAFWECSELRSVTIGRNVAEIKALAFYGCKKLTDLYFDGTVETWNLINKNEDWNAESVISVVHCSNGDVKIEPHQPPEPESDGSRGLEYRIEGDHAVLVGIGTCTYADVIVASVYNGVPVTEICEEAFLYADHVKSVTIPEGVTAIRYGAFNGCKNLEKITIPSSVTEIFDYAFMHLDALAEISVADGNKRYYVKNNCLIDREEKKLLRGFKGCSIPNDGSVTIIGEQAFSGCQWLTHIEVPGTVTWIGDQAFVRCYSLKEVTLSEGLQTISSSFGSCTALGSITIPNSVTTIYEFSFSDCTALETVKLGNGITTLSAGTFMNCTSLREINLPIGLKSVDESLFEGCTSLVSIVIPESVKSIVDYAFLGCTNLESVTLPAEGLEKFWHEAFSGCIRLKNISIPSTVDYIGSEVFFGCELITELTLPKSITKLEYDAFAGCTNLAKLNYKGTVAEWNAIEKQDRWNEGCPFTVVHCSDGDVDLIEHDGSRGLEYRIEGDHAVIVGMGGCKDKDVVTATTYDGLPVTEIGAFAFENVGGFTSITVSEGVTSIGLHAFSNCPDLREINLPSTLDDIYGGEGIAFFGCDALEIISMAENNPKYYSLGNCLIERDTKTVAFGCKNSKIPSDGSVGQIGDFAFSGISSIKEIVIPEGITEIMQLAFSMCDNLKKITLPDSLTKIGWGAFSSCSSLESIEVGDNVTYIGSRAFAGCTKLKNVTLPKRLDYLGEEVFASTSIESIAIPEGIKEFYGGMFANCRNLRSVSLPAELERIGGSAFSQCFALQSIKIPEGVTEIGDYTFSSCTNLKEVTLPESLTSIGYNAFASCTSLERISLPAAVTKIGHDAFRGCTALTEFIFGGDAEVWNGVKKDANWRTETGIEIIKCSDREVDAGYTQPDYSSLSSVPEVYRNIIENKTAFYYCPTGAEIFLDDIVFLFSTREEKITESEVRYSVLDMNGDGDPELVVTNLFDVLVFNDEGGTVYCYMLRKNNGWVRDIAVDGTFEWQEPGYSPADNIIIGKLQFSGTDCTIIEVYRRTNVGSSMEPSYEYYVNKRRVSEAEAKDFRSTLAIDLVCQYLIDRYPIVKD